LFELPIAYNRKQTRPLAHAILGSWSTVFWLALESSEVIGLSVAKLALAKEAVRYICADDKFTTIGYLSEEQKLIDFLLDPPYLEYIIRNDLNY
jgi:hypothetical protein